MEFVMRGFSMNPLRRLSPSSFGWLLCVQAQALMALHLPLLFEMWVRPAPDGGQQAWIGPALMAASAIGGILGKSAESSAKGRADEARLLNERDRTALDRYGIQQNAQFAAGQQDLSRKQFSEQARGGRARQATIADMLANFKPLSINVPGVRSAEINGGLQIGEGAKASLGQLYKDALLRQLEGDKFDGGQVLNAPNLSELPKRSGWEKFAGIGGMLGSIAGAFAPMANKAPMASVPSIPGVMGPPAQLPGTAMSGLSIPDAPPDLRDYLAEIEALTRGGADPRASFAGSSSRPGGR